MALLSDCILKRKSNSCNKSISVILMFIRRFAFDFMPGQHHMGLILTMILGLVGAWLGGLIGRLTGMYKEGHPAGWFMAPMRRCVPTINSTAGRCARRPAWSL